MKTNFFKIISILTLVICLSIIGILVAALNLAEERLEKISGIVDEMAVLHIKTDVSLDETIPLKTYL